MVVRKKFIVILIAIVFTVLLVKFENYYLFKDKLFLVIGNEVGHYANQIETIKIDTSLIKPIKLFCLIVTSKDSFNSKAKIVNDVWALKCDKSVFVKVIDRNNTKSVQTVINGLTVLQPKNFVNDSYEELTEKMFRALITINEEFNDYDWYLKADDDTFVFVNNLRKFLSDKDPLKPVTFGYDFKPLVDKGYHSGGGGYVWSNEALKRIGTRLIKDIKSCKRIGFEDVDVAKCFRAVGVNPMPSIDKEGRERFHPLGFLSHYQGDFPDWMYSYAKNPIKKGVECCSEESISFHYVSGEEMKKMSALLKKYETQLVGNKSSKHSLSSILLQLL